VFPVQALFPALFPSLPTRRHECAEAREGFDGNGTQHLIPVFETEALSVNEIERLPRMCPANASLDYQVVIAAKHWQRIKLDQALVAKALTNAGLSKGVRSPVQAYGPQLIDSRLCDTPVKHHFLSDKWIRPAGLDVPDTLTVHQLYAGMCENATSTTGQGGRCASPQNTENKKVRAR